MFLRRLLIGLLCAALPRPGLAVCAIDLSAQRGNLGTIVTISTTQSDMIIIGMWNGGHYGTTTAASIGSVTDTAGLAYKSRVTVNVPRPGFGWNQEVWWALAPGALTNDQIQVNFATGDPGHVDWAVVAVSGTAGWDTNSSLPAQQTYASDVIGMPVSVSGVSTSNPFDMIWLTCGTTQFNQCEQAPIPIPGYTQLFHVSRTDLGGTMGGSLQESIVTSSLGNATITLDPIADNIDWTLIADALKCSGSPPPLPPFVWINE